MNLIKKILHGIDVMNEWSGNIFKFLILLLTGIVVYDVFMRYVFNSPTIWGLEVSCMLLAAVTFLGAGFSFLHGVHVKVDIVYARWPRRTQAIIDVITAPFILATCFILLLFGFPVTLESFLHGKTTSSAWAPPLWISQILVPVGAILLGLQALGKWVRDLNIALTGKDHLASRVYSGAGGIFDRKEEKEKVPGQK